MFDFLFLKQGRDFILDLIFPIECLACGREGKWLCPECFPRLKFKPSQYCLACKKENDFGGLCRSCRPLYFFDGVFIAGDYDNKTVAEMVKKLKYNLAKDLADDLGKFLALFVRNLISGSLNFSTQFIELPGRGNRLNGLPSVLRNLEKNLIIPIPLHPRRERWRGFNQAELLARRFAEYFNLEISTDYLKRIKHKKPQAKLNEAARSENIKDCFAFKGENLAGRNILLVDDIITTGHTLSEAARVLKENGAGQVWGLVVAKG